MPTTLNLYLIRHGQTEYNAAGIVQGWCDSPLTAEGKAGAAQTGNAIAQELGYGSVEDWLADYRSGKHSNNQLMHTLHRIDPRAEQESQFIQRLHRGIQHIIANSLARSTEGSLKTESSGEIPTPNVLIVSHGMAITALLRSINPQAIPYRSVPNASATLLRYNLIGGLQIISEAGKALPLP